MPVHDWSRVSAGTFHDFHLAWIAELRRALNGGVLPAGYYAQAEQVAGEVIPDVLTLQGPGEFDVGSSDSSDDDSASGVAVATKAPAARVHDVADEAALLAARQRRLVIRHTTGDRIVALLEIISPGNKQSIMEVDSFADKAIAALRSGFHLMVLDLFPPGPSNPSGIHGAIWERIGKSYRQPADESLTLAAYISAPQVECFVEPMAVGSKMIPMPLFLDREHYVDVPLEATYMAAYEGVPLRWKRVIEGTA